MRLTFSQLRSVDVYAEIASGLATCAFCGVKIDKGTRGVTLRVNSRCAPHFHADCLINAGQEAKQITDKQILDDDARLDAEREARRAAWEAEYQQRVRPDGQLR